MQSRFCERQQLQAGQINQKSSIFTVPCLHLRLPDSGDKHRRSVSIPVGRSCSTGVVQLASSCPPGIAILESTIWARVNSRFLRGFVLEDRPHLCCKLTSIDRSVLSRAKDPCLSWRCKEATLCSTDLVWFWWFHSVCT